MSVLPARTIHLLTACTRPENLPRMATEIEVADTALRKLGWRLEWRLGFDPHREAIGGQRVKNLLLDGFHSGWAHILDDDTLPSVEALQGAVRALQEAPDAALLVISQRRNDGVGGGFLLAERGNLRVGSIDAGQLFINREKLGALRIPEAYDGDGQFVELLVAQHPPEAILFRPYLVCDYNSLRR